MAEPAQTTRPAPLRRDAVLEAVTFAAERLLLAADWHDAIDEVLARFGIAAGVSRATILRADPGEDAGPLATAEAEWCAPGVPSMADHPSLRSEPWSPRFARWVDAMTAGQPIVGDVGTFPPAEREDFTAQGIVSLAYYPITVEGAWWGCIGFEDCDGPRAWVLSDLDGVRTAAAMIGAAITRQRQEERLRDAETRYRGVVERIPAVTYVDELTPDGVRMSFLSPQIERLLGYPATMFLDEPDAWFDVVHPDDQERVDAAARRAGSEGTPFDEEYRMRHADGRWLWVHDTSAPMSTEDGEGTTYFQGFLVEISARKEAEAARAEAEHRYRTMVEALPAVTYIDEPVEGEDINATMPFVSPQIETVLGYPPERFLQDSRFWFDLMHPDDYARLRETGDLSVSNVWESTQEYRMRHADGHWVWVQDTSRPVFDDDGELIFFQGFLMDVSTRHEAEEGLRAAEQRFRVLVEQMPAAIYTETIESGSADGLAIDYLSPQFERLFRLSPDEILGDTAHWPRLVHPEDRAAFIAENERVNRTGEPFSMDYRITASDGSTIWVHDEAQLIRGEDGEPAYWQGFLTDVTERVEAAERIRVAEERYRQIVEHTPVITYQELPSDEDGAFTSMTSMYYVSPQIEEILGYPVARWSEPGFWATITEPEDMAIVEGDARNGERGDTYRGEYRMRAADGRIVWFHDEAQLIRSIDGTPVSWQGVMVDVTERREAEQELRLARERLEALIEHIPAIVYRESDDEDPAKFFVSPQVERILGYTPGQWTWTEDFWVDRLHPDDRDRVLALDLESGRTHQPYSIEYRFRRADGAYVWLQEEAVFLPSEPGELGAWQGLLFDVTARKEAEEQLRESELVQSATVEHLPAIVYREPPDGPLAGNLYVSPQVRDLLGYTQEEWTTSEVDFWAEHIHPDDAPAVLAANTHANETKEPFDTEYRIQHADGSYRWVHDEATFVADLGGGWWQGFMIDISERRTAEEQLREAEERFRLIVERGPAVFYQQEFDPDDPDVSRTTYVSPQQGALFGYSDDEMLEDPTLWAKTIHPDDRDRVLAADVASNRDVDEHFSMEYRMISKDGRIVWVQDTCSLVRVAGKAPYWQGFILDITERKQAEDQLARALEVEREATRRLRALDDMKNTFLQAVSHDLRTPLAAILGLAITLERGDVHLEEDDAKDLARRIAGNARRLDRLVTNLLDLDRLARGIVAPNLQPTDVGSVVRRVLSESELIPDARLRTDIRPVMVRADGSKVERIVENLLANTVRHTPTTATIWVSVTATDEGALLAVEDDGAGVAEELRETIFEPFQQGPDAPRHSPGVGVGLTLVRRFAELHGGRAWVEDREGGGASFRVLLPIEPPGTAATVASADGRPDAGVE